MKLLIISTVIAFISTFLVVYLSWIRTPFAIIPMVYLFGHIVIVTVTNTFNNENKKEGK